MGFWSQIQNGLKEGSMTNLYSSLRGDLNWKLKISASGQNFLDPLSPLKKKGPTNKNASILYLIVIIKFVFFQNFKPPSPYLIRKPNLTNFYQFRWPLRRANLFLPKKSRHFLWICYAWVGGGTDNDSQYCYILTDILVGKSL